MNISNGRGIFLRKRNGGPLDLANRGVAVQNVAFHCNRALRDNVNNGLRTELKTLVRSYHFIRPPTNRGGIMQKTYLTIDSRNAIIEGYFVKGTEAPGKSRATIGSPIHGKLNLCVGKNLIRGYMVDGGMVCKTRECPGRGGKYNMRVTKNAVHGYLVASGRVASNVRKRAHASTTNICHANNEVRGYAVIKGDTNSTYKNCCSAASSTSTIVGAVVCSGVGNMGNTKRADTINNSSTGLDKNTRRAVLSYRVSGPHFHAMGNGPFTLAATSPYFGDNAGLL